MSKNTGGRSSTISVPYILIVGRLLLGQPMFEVHAHEPWGLVPAVIFCSGVVLLVGAGLERAVRALRAVVRRRWRPK